MMRLPRLTPTCNSQKLVHWYYSQTKGSTDVPREDVETAIARLRVHVRDPSKPRTVRERRLQEVIDRLKEDSG